MSTQIIKVLLLALTISSVVSTFKRGLGWPWNAVSSDFGLFSGNSEVTWVYNWEAWVPPGKPGNLDYVAMQRTADDINQLDSYMQNNDAKILLGFNEPDNSGQANMSPEEAVSLWHQYILPVASKHGLRFGSPAISNGPDGLPWLKTFMSECSDCNVDFVCMHWYGPDFNSFKAQVQAVHSAFNNKNIWVTEFALQGTPSADDQIAFLNQATSYMDSTGFVERYAWFGAFRGTTGNVMITESGSLTQLGSDYKA